MYPLYIPFFNCYNRLCDRFFTIQKSQFNSFENKMNNNDNNFKRRMVEGNPIRVNASPLKYTFIKFKVDGKSRFVIAQNHSGGNRMPQKYFQFNRWSGKITKHVSAMRAIEEFAGIMGPFNLFATNADNLTLKSSFIILNGKDLERKNKSNF